MMRAWVWSAALLLVPALPACSALGKDTTTRLYPAEPGAEFDDRFELSVQGRPTRLQFYRNSTPGKRHFMDTARVRFAADGPVDIELLTRKAAPARAFLRTLGRDLQFERDGSTMKFRLPGPGHYYLQLPDLAGPDGTFTVLFWIDDLEEFERTQIDPNNSDVKDVTARGVKSDPSKDQTRAIQAVLDEGGVIYVPAGVYRAGTLRIGSNTTLYMAPGSLLKAVDSDSAVAAEFIAIKDAQNVNILGCGTIDANGKVGFDHNVHNVNIISRSNVLFRDVLFQNSNSWAIHIRTSERFTGRNLKVFSGKDGLDPDSSRDVLLDGIFVVSIDDAVAIKNRYPDEPDGKTTERVTIRNAIVSSTKSA
ncbi:MAG: hypothetical protein JSU94_12735, partial [Phycisphaerales bacterium]